MGGSSLRVGHGEARSESLLLVVATGLTSSSHWTPSSHWQALAPISESTAHASWHWQRRPLAPWRLVRVGPSRLGTAINNRGGQVNLKSGELALSDKHLRCSYCNATYRTGTSMVRPWYCNLKRYCKPEGTALSGSSTAQAPQPNVTRTPGSALHSRCL